MNDNRRNQRVNLLGSGWLTHNITKYSCRLVNISKNGALIILNNPPRDPLYTENICTLEILRADTQQPFLTIEATVVRFESGLVALDFAELSAEQLELLGNFIQKEYIFIDGGQSLIDFVQETAAGKGMCLEMPRLDSDETKQGTELVTLRLSVEGRSVDIHLHRDEIEAFYSLKKIRLTKTKILDAIAGLA